MVIVMEKLKEFQKLLEPDPVQNEILLYDHESGTYNKLTLEDIHSYAESIYLEDSVPGHIREHFERAKNLLVYSWFVFSFAMTAQLHAYICVELALRSKGNNRKSTFSTLLKAALQSKSIVDSEFSMPETIRKEKIVKVGPEEWNIVDQLLSSEYSDDQLYSRTVLENLRKLRNKLAHGSNEVNDGGFQSVKLCAEVINQIFSTGAVSPNKRLQGDAAKPRA